MTMSVVMSVPHYAIFDACFPVRSGMQACKRSMARSEEAAGM